MLELSEEFVSATVVAQKKLSVTAATEKQLDVFYMIFLLQILSFIPY